MMQHEWDIKVKQLEVNLGIRSWRNDMDLLVSNMPMYLLEHVINPDVKPSWGWNREWLERCQQEYLERQILQDDER